jgi:hypothetical protein
MPVDVIVRSEVDDLHRGVWVGTSEEELEGTAEERTRPGIARPPSGETLRRGQRLVDG